MANEAQRLIAMSMEKIMSSRSRCGGINLRHNLLVANVLLKARRVYMMANYEAVMEARLVQENEPDKPVKVEAADSTSDTASSTVTTEDTTVTSVIDQTSAHVDTMESDLVVTESSESNNRLGPNTCDTDEENAPPPMHDNKNCSRYTKRRLAEVDSNQKNTKKARVEASLMERLEQWILPGNRVK